jgi:thymidylate synthase
MKSIFNIILAVDKEFGYDKDGQIPWMGLHPEDMKMFKKTTIGEGNNCVLMGRKTWESIGKKPLVDRYNIILTKNVNNIQNGDNFEMTNSVEEALKSIYNKKFDNIFILGGESLWCEFLNRKLVNKIFITMIPDNFYYHCTKHFDIFSHKRFKDFKLIEENELKGKDSNDSTNINIMDKKPAILKIFKYHNKEELLFLTTLDKIIKKGIYKMDRSGVGTYSLFGKSFTYDIKNYRLPVFTHRKVFIRGIIEELLFFISGKTNTKVLEEKKVNIWKQHTSREYLDKMGLSSDKYKDGSYGPAYGFQLRHWGAEFEGDDADYTGKGIDQLQYIVDLLKDKEKRNSRRILFSYWNPSVIEMVPLPSCHVMYIFFVNPETEELSVSFFQRSNDFALAAVFNIVSASLLTFMLCKITGLKPGKCVHNIGDLHLYSNQIESVKQFMSNSYDINYPVMGFKEKKYENMEDFSCEDFILMFYNSYKKYTIPFST